MIDKLENMSVLTIPASFIKTRIASGSKLTIDLPQEDGMEWIGRKVYLISAARVRLTVELEEVPIISEVKSVGQAGIARVRFTIPEELRGKLVMGVVPRD